MLKRAALVLAQFPAGCSGGVCREVSQIGRSSGRGCRHLQLMGQVLAGPGWDQEQQQPKPSTPTKEALGKHLETRNDVTRADGTEGPCQLSWELWCPPCTKPGTLRSLHPTLTEPGGHSAHSVPAAGWALLLLQLHPAALGRALLLEEILPLVPELQDEVRRLRNASDCERESPGITTCLPWDQPKRQKDASYGGFPLPGRVWGQAGGLWATSLWSWQGKCHGWSLRSPPTQTISGSSDSLSSIHLPERTDRSKGMN